MSSYAPIVLFVYNRPEHTRRTLEALSANTGAEESELYVFADGPKPGAPEEDLQRISAVRSLIQEKKWCGKVHCRFSETNKGLSASVIDGVTEIVNQYGAVIVLEDDLVTSPFFLQFMNGSLEKYAEDERVACISGYIYPLRKEVPETFFLRGADCWGWATWKRAWKLFDPDGKKLLDSILSQNLREDFDFGNAYPYTQMLQDQVEGKISSWAIRWYASAYLAGKLCLYPGKSLVLNIGVDGSGTHSGVSDDWKVNLLQHCPRIGTISVEENPHAREAVSHFFWNLRTIPVEKRIGGWFRRIFGK